MKNGSVLQRVGCPKKIGSFTYHARVINEQKDDCLGTSCPWFFAQNANYCACDVAHGCCLMSDVAVIEEPKIDLVHGRRPPRGIVLDMDFEREPEGPGSKAQSEAQRFAHAVPHGQQKSADKNSAKQGRCAIAAACRSKGVARLVDAHGCPRHGRNLARLQVGVSVAAVSERPLQHSSARGTVRPWPFNDFEACEPEGPAARSASDGL